MNNHYDIIYVSESGFQQKIIEYLIANIYPTKNYLWLKGEGGHFVDNEGRIYNIDLNHVKGIFSSITSIFKFPKLTCDYLIGTQFTSVNSRFFEAFVSYTELHLIDDGIGTPLILKTPTFFISQPTTILKFALLKIFALMKYKNVKSASNIIRSLNKCYSIYNINIIGIPIVKINPFSSLNIVVKEDFIGFIGMPLVEYGMLKEEFYLMHLNRIIKHYDKPIKYYPDPSEKLIFKHDIVNLEIIKKNEPLESYVEKNGIPFIVISFVSSALLNLKLLCPQVEAYYCKIPNHDKKRKLYYDIFEENKIKLLNL